MFLLFCSKILAPSSIYICIYKKHKTCSYCKLRLNATRDLLLMCLPFAITFKTFAQLLFSAVPGDDRDCRCCYCCCHSNGVVIYYKWSYLYVWCGVCSGLRSTDISSTLDPLHSTLSIFVLFVNLKIGKITFAGIPLMEKRFPGIPIQ